MVKPERHDPGPAIIRSALREIIENQMRDGDPPETKETFDRLISEGIPEAEVWRLLSRVVLHELYGVLNERRVFNRAEYVKTLKGLPELPYE
jgi:hypothetical protein